MTSSSRPDAPLVSVVMPVHDTARYIEEAVRSVLQQTVSDLELIVVDDESTDESVELVRAIGDPRVRYLAQPRGGDGPARDAGLAAARGEFVVWQDSDDVALPARVERMLSAMVEGVDFVHHDMLFMTPEGQQFGYQRASNMAREHVLPYMLREGCPFNCGTVMLRRSSVEGLRHSWDRVNNDVDFMRRLAPRANGVHLPEPLYLYRKHPRSTLATMDRRDDWPHLRRLLDEEPLPELVPDAFTSAWSDAEAEAVALAYAALCLCRRNLVENAQELAARATEAPLGPAAAAVVSAILHLAGGQVPAALARLEHAPDVAISHVLRGDCHALAGDVVVANRCYQRALTANPLSFDALSGLRATGQAGSLWVLDDPGRRLLRRAAA